KNTLTVEGFPKEGAYQVDLITVGRDEQRSEPITITVNPEKPPVTRAFESLDVFADFGGIGITGENTFESNLVYEVLIKDAQGQWKVADQHYTRMKDVNFAIRGMD